MIVYCIVEGDSEEELIRNLKYQALHSYTMYYRDFISFYEDFLTNPTGDFLFIDYAEGVERIPHLLNEQWHNIQKISNVRILIVCDSEKTCSLDCRKALIEAVLDDAIPRELFTYIISVPMIEKIFFNHPVALLSTFKYFYKEKYESDLPSNSPLVGSLTGNDKQSLKEIFKKEKMKYRESAFAKCFFGKLDIESSTDSTLLELMDFFNTPKQLSL